MIKDASTVVRSLVDQAAPEKQESGLRISQDDVESPALNVIPADQPSPGDQVLDEDGARVFLEETAAVTLDHKILDAQVDADGGVQFTIANQDGLGLT